MFWYWPVVWAAKVGIRMSGTQFSVSCCHDGGLNGPALTPRISIVPAGTCPTTGSSCAKPVLLMLRVYACTAI